MYLHNFKVRKRSKLRKLVDNQFNEIQDWILKLSKVNLLQFGISKKAINYKRGRNYSYHNILFDNIQQLASFVSNKNINLPFDIPQIKTKREDNLDLRNRILNMTSDERRKLGINKSTLWYQKKNLGMRGKIKIYNKVYSKLV
jgi:hypothetical protein